MEGYVDNTMSEEEVDLRKRTHISPSQPWGPYQGGPDYVPGSTEPSDTFGRQWPASNHSLYNPEAQPPMSYGQLSSTDASGSSEIDWNSYLSMSPTDDTQSLEQIEEPSRRDGKTYTDENTNIDRERLVSSMVSPDIDIFSPNGTRLHHIDTVAHLERAGMVTNPGEDQHITGLMNSEPFGRRQTEGFEAFSVHPLSIEALLFLEQQKVEPFPWSQGVVESSNVQTGGRSTTHNPEKHMSPSGPTILRLWSQDNGEKMPTIEEALSWAQLLQSTPNTVLSWFRQRNPLSQTMSAPLPAALDEADQDQLKMPNKEEEERLITEWSNKKGTKHSHKSASVPDGIECLECPHKYPRDFKKWFRYVSDQYGQGLYHCPHCGELHGRHFDHHLKTEHGYKPDAEFKTILKQRRLSERPFEGFCEECETPIKGFRAFYKHVWQHLLDGEYPLPKKTKRDPEDDDDVRDGENPQKKRPHQAESEPHRKTLSTNDASSRHSGDAGRRGQGGRTRANTAPSYFRSAEVGSRSGNIRSAKLESRLRGYSQVAARGTNEEVLRMPHSTPRSLSEVKPPADGPSRRNDRPIVHIHLDQGGFDKGEGPSLRRSGRDLPTKLALTGSRRSTTPAGLSVLSYLEHERLDQVGGGIHKAQEEVVHGRVG